MENIYKTLSNIKSRTIHAALLVILIVTIMYPVRLPIPITHWTREFYESIETVEPGDVVLVFNSFGPSLWNELGSGMSVTFWHLLQQNPKIILASMEPTAIPIVDYLLNEPAVKNKMDELNYVEGVDYTNIGLVYQEAGLVELIQDFHGATRDEYRGTWLDDVENGGDIDYVLDFSGGSMSYKLFAQHMYVNYRTPIATIQGAGTFPTAIVYVSAGQFVAALNGPIGSSEYEMLSAPNGWSLSDNLLLMGTYSAAHLLLIVLTILGNIGYYGMKRMENNRSEL